MPTTNSTDRLQRELDNIQRLCDRQGLKLIQGFMEETGSLPIVLWNEESENSIDHFLSILKEAGVKLLIANVTRLTHEDWQNKLEEEAGKSNEEQKSLSELRACESRIGWLAAIELRAVTNSPSMVLNYDIFADWFDVIYAEEQDDADNSAEEEAGIEKLGSFARRLAKEPKFHQARNRIQREYVARNLFKGEAAFTISEVRQVVSEAELIYDTEIKPAIEDARIKQVQKLHNDGLSVKEISAQLHLSISEINAML